MYTEIENKRNFKITKAEFKDLVIAWLAISFAFAFSWNYLSFLVFLPVVLIATLTGFIVHELAHKFTAIYYHAHAEFVMWKIGVIFAVIMAIAIGFVFAAPGAVYISGAHLTRRQNGIISISGPLSNLIFGVIFLILFLLVPTGFLGFAFRTISFVNIFLGAFNMLPIYPLDGSKVLVWNKIIWLVTFAIFGGLVYLLFTI